MFGCIKNLETIYPIFFTCRVCGIAENDTLLTSAEEKTIQDETCNLNTPDTDTPRYFTPSENEKLIEDQLCRGEERKKVCYLSLGCANCALGYYEKSVVFFEKAAELAKGEGDKEIEFRAYTNLAIAFDVLGNRDKVRDYSEKALNLVENDEGTDLKQRCVLYNKQGMLYQNIGAYEKSLKVHERSLDLSKNLIDKQEEGKSHYYLGTVYSAIGQYENAIEHHTECLQMRIERGDVHGQGISCIQLAYLHYNKEKYKKSVHYLEKTLQASMETGARQMEATSYGNLAYLYQVLGQYKKSIEYDEKCISMRRNLGASRMERKAFRHLSGIYHALGDHKRASGCHVRSFLDDKQANEFICSTSDCLQEESFQIIEVMEGNNNDRFLLSRTVHSHATNLNVTEASKYLSESIKRHEKIRQNHDDKFKLSLDDQTVPLYKTHSLLLTSSRFANASLFVLEQGRARALVDLMWKTYEFHASSTKSTAGIDINTLSSLVARQNCEFLFMAFLMPNNLALWFVDKEEKLSLRQYSEPDPRIKTTKDLLETLTKELMATMKTEEDDKEATPEEDQERDRKRDLCLRKLYQAVIAPIARLMKGPEMIIVPEGQMFLVPFAALKDNSGRYLSDKVRIRLIPSLTALKIIQESPADYHCQDGALIVGVPYVGLLKFSPLPYVEKEVNMIRTLLGTSCLVGNQATKKEVLRRIQEPVCLVHIATHGSEETGEPALAFASSKNKKEPVQWEDFVLTIQNIARLKIRAKLVVLSYCYGARGRVMAAEGVVGIARAFLGSGARSVLVSLWQVRDEAACTFMYIFYKNLALNKMSASEALHQTQREMRSSTWGFKDEQDWASFVLLGDNVTIDLVTD